MVADHGEFWNFVIDFERYVEFLPAGDIQFDSMLYDAPDREPPRVVLNFSRFDLLHIEQVVDQIR